MLSIKSILDIIVHINLINNLIGILLESSSENDDLIMLGHKFNKLNASWSNQEEAVVSIFNIMNQGFVQIKNERISFGDV